jgi:hypothetical protein
MMTESLGRSVVERMVSERTLSGTSIRRTTITGSIRSRPVSTPATRCA